MNISNDTGGIDSSKFLDYIKTQFPVDLAQMVSLQAELEKRQGAMAAVETANKQLADANEYAQNSKAAADKLLEEAKANNVDSKNKQAALIARQNEFNATQSEINAANAETAKDLKNKEDSLAAREVGLTNAQNQLKIDQETLETDRANLETRIKSLQDKIALISI